MNASRYGDYAETAARYRIAKGTLQNWVSARRVPFIKLGGRIVFDLDEMDAFVAQHRVEPLDPKTADRVLLGDIPRARA